MSLVGVEQELISRWSSKVKGQGQGTSAFGFWPLGRSIFSSSQGTPFKFSTIVQLHTNWLDFRVKGQGDFDLPPGPPVYYISKAPWGDFLGFGTSMHLDMEVNYILALKCKDFCEFKSNISLFLIFLFKPHKTFSNWRPRSKNCHHVICINIFL